MLIRIYTTVQKFGKQKILLVFSEDALNGFKKSVKTAKYFYSK